MKNTKRILLAAVAALLLVAVSVGGTLAWLVDNTDPVTNTFTAANIQITLTETKAPDGTTLDANEKWEAQLIPGKEYAKDPVVAVDTTNTTVPIYVYVKVEDTNASTYVGYTTTLTAANGWTQVTGATNVYWRAWAPGDETSSWSLIEDNKVTVKSDLTKDGANGTTSSNNSATLTFTAYAIQQEGFTAVEGWAQLNKTNPATDPKTSGT